MPEETILYKEFIEYCFQNSNTYKRASAYFSSNIFNDLIDGIDYFYRNPNSKIQYIFSEQISQDDFDQMKLGYKLRSESNIINMWRNNLDLVEKESLSKLAYLIKIGIVDIKICFSANHSGIFHAKFGIFKNNELHTYAHMGSNNETSNAIKRNVEIVTALNPDDDINRIIELDSAFDDWWNNKKENTICVDLPNTLYKEIVDKSYEGELYFTNCIYLDINENRYLTIINDNNISLSSYEYDVNIKNITIQKGDNIIFNNINKISDIKYYIEKIESLCLSKGITLIKKPSLSKFLLNRELYANERMQWGKYLKSRNFLNDDKFLKFKSFVISELKRKPHEMQIEDMYFMLTMTRSANFSVPGSGKTTVVYGAYSYLKYNKNINKMVVICPINAFKSWEDEFFLNFGFKGKFYKKNDINTKENLFYLQNYHNDMDVILINFESLKSHINLLKKIIDEKTMIVIDEYHRIKNPNGIYAAMVKELSGLAKYRVCITGTPIPNGYKDILNLLDILFKEENIFEDYESIQKLSNMSLYDVKKFSELFTPFFIRRNKNMLGVPKPEPDIICYCKANEYERCIIQFIYNKYKNPLTRFIRICQASTSPKSLFASLDKNEISDLFEDSIESNDAISYNEDINLDKIELNDEVINAINNIGIPTKISTAIETIMGIINGGNSVVVWANFKCTINEVSKILSEENISYKIITGDTEISERNNIIESFKNQEFLILLTNPHTLAESVSLHMNCHNAVYIDYSFNLVHLLQSKDRIHRLGLAKNVKTNYYFIALKIGDDLIDDNSSNTIMKSSLDAHILDIMRKKEIIMSNLVDNDEFKYEDMQLQLTDEDINNFLKDLNL